MIGKGKIKIELDLEVQFDSEMRTLEDVAQWLEQYTTIETPCYEKTDIVITKFDTTKSIVR